MNRPLETIVDQPLGLHETILAEISRANPEGGWGPSKELDTFDLITNAGRSYLAQRIGADVNSPMAHMAVGTVSTAAALADTAMTGEIARLALAANSANTNNIYTAVSTFGGFADSVTSEVIREGGIFNSAASGQGTMFQRVTFAAVTLADSDILKLTLQANIGSNTI